MGLFRKTKEVDIFFVGCDGTRIDRGIYSFYLETTTGEIIKKSFVKSQANPLSMSRDKRWIYITYRNGSGLASDGGIWQYACAETQLGLAARVSHEGRTYVKLLTAPDRKHAYAIDYYNGEIVTIPIKTMKIIRVSEVIKLEGKSIDPIKQTESHPTDILLTPDNRVVVLDMGADEILIYDMDERGYLQKNQELCFKVEAGSGPKKMVFTQNGKYAYVINEINSQIYVYAYDNGEFTRIQSLLSYLPEEFQGENIVTDIVITSDDKKLLVTNKGDDTLVLFDILEDGTIKRIDCIEVDEGPNRMLLFKDRFVVITSKSLGTIESFEIKQNEKRGVLFETHYRLALHGPVCMEKGNENLRVVK